MTAQQIFRKTDELVQAIKDQPTEALVDIWRECECGSTDADETLGGLIKDELKRRFPDSYDEWFRNMFIGIESFLDCQ